MNEYNKKMYKLMIEHVVENAEKLASDNDSNLYWIENENYPDGVYRIHHTALIAPMFNSICPFDEISDVVAEFPNVKLDFGGWITFTVSD